MDYKQKYLKYKTKYLELKKLIEGGTDNINIEQNGGGTHRQNFLKKSNP